VLRGRVEAPVEQWDFDRVVASYTEKRLRVRYAEAARSLREDGLCKPRDSEIKAFVKGEKLAKDKVHKPRVIMARAPRYNLELASYLKPIEHVLYGGLRGFGSQFYTHTRLVAKGLSPTQRASLIRKKMSSIPDCRVFEVDGKSFESHFTKDVLRIEHSFYRMFNSSPRLARLLSWQLSSKGSGEGVDFKLGGARASGGYNTGMGNSIVMVLIVMAVARRLRTRYDCLVDGDNAILFLTASDVPAWRETFPTVAEEAGFEMSLEDPVSELEAVVFGQSKPAFVGGTWTMVRDPFKVMSHAACGYKHFSDPRGGLRVLKSIAYCEAVLNRGIPVLQEFAHALLRATASAGFSKAEVDDFEYKRVLARGVRWEEAVKVPITAEARVGFEKSWGVPEEAQRRMEAVLSRGFKPPDSWQTVDLEVETRDGRDLCSLVSHRHAAYERPVF